MTRKPARLLTAKPANARPGRRAARSQADQIVRLGLRETLTSDLYHRALTVEWRLFLLAAALIYIGINLVFAGLYILQPGSITNAAGFADAFFFSVQTIATIGYGAMAPATIYANLLVTVETLVGLSLLAIATGLVFARFSRPTARVVFSRHAVVRPRNGTPTLMFRMANQRRNQILQAEVAITLVRDEITAEGEAMRRFYDLHLVRAHSPVFVMSFTVMHDIDATSPLFGATAESLAAQDAELVVSMIGIDETVAQPVHARWSYRAEDIRWNHRLVDVLGYLEDGRRALDFTRFHETEPDGPGT